MCKLTDSALSNSSHPTGKDVDDSLIQRLFQKQADTGSSPKNSKYASTIYH